MDNSIKDNRCDKPNNSILDWNSIKNIPNFYDESSDESNDNDLFPEIKLKMSESINFQD